MIKNRHHLLKNSLIYASLGFFTQLILTFIIGSAALFQRDKLIYIGFYSICAGLPIWLHLIITYIFLKKEVLFGLSRQSSGKTGEKRGENSRDKIIGIHRFYQKYLTLIPETGCAAILAFGSLSLFTQVKISASNVQAQYLSNIALFAVLSFFSIIASIYFITLSRSGFSKLLTMGIGYVIVSAIVSLFLCINFILRYLHYDGASNLFWYILPAINLILCTEICFFIIVKFFRPQYLSHIPRPAFHSYILDGLLKPAQMMSVFKGMLHDLLGFDVSATYFVRLTRLLIIPVVLLSFLLLEFLSCLVIVRPNQQAVFTQFGIIRNRILGPGIHLKAPWPIGSAFIYNTGEVRRVHAGSHRTTNRGDQIYRSGIPILWTNRHGISNEELIIISSPTNLIHDAEKSGGKIRFEKTAPSISLVGTDIVVEYNVDNLLHYIQSSDNPERLLYNFARSCASRLLFRYDIDALFCEDRLDLAEELKFIIQKTCNSHNLGINILHVGVTAVHPPLDVAQSFEETVTAMQERETSIQQARQASLLQQVETAGSIEDFNKMIALINDSERGTLVTSSTESKRLFRNVGGKVSKILSEAFAYRWSREHKERGKTERFSQESKLDKIALKKYRYDRYLAVLENGLEYSKKVILTDDCDDVIIRMNALQDGIKRIEISDELLE